jgi:hypothetical protein
LIQWRPWRRDARAESRTRRLRRLPQSLRELPRRESRHRWRITRQFQDSPGGLPEWSQERRQTALSPAPAISDFFALTGPMGRARTPKATATPYPSTRHGAVFWSAGSEGSVWHRSCCKFPEPDSGPAHPSASPGPQRTGKFRMLRICAGLSRQSYRAFTAAQLSLSTRT